VASLRIAHRLPQIRRSSCTSSTHSSRTDTDAGLDKTSSKVTNITRSA
jgi:hypothetical protein